MMRHGDIQLLLYEYLNDELSSQDRAAVDDHLSTCTDCARELKSLREALALLPPPVTPPSEERAGEFWNAFASSVVEKIAEQKRARKNPFVELIDLLEDVLLLRPRLVYAVIGSAAVLFVALAIWTLYPRTNVDVAGNMPKLDSVSLEHKSQPVTFVRDPQLLVPDRRVSQYFRKSKMLLVGLTNMKTERGEPLDFSSERRLSRDLIREARYLRQQPLDGRSRRLMSDLEKILIELKNVEERSDLPDIDIIRSGIHQENLLFKIRMAEAMFDSSRFITARENR